ncbi:glutathione S-transferase family protein [Tateyamaria sp. SN3-11]|uniref:glutathione S-transferase family protein n=1 Tax=Tateyamaria sp. SN3-11 TaxID=3092147 RepID=UPI0039E91FE1
MTVTLFHSPGTRSVRPLWLMEEMGLPYDLKTIGYDSAYFASEQFRKINPMGKVPALYDGETLIAESTAILQYLLHRFVPSEFTVTPDDPEYATYLQWLHMAEGGMANYVAVSFGQTLSQDPYKVSDAFDAYCRYQVEKALGMLETQLEGQDYLLKRGFSAAEISLGYSLIFAQGCISATFTPRVDAYLGGLMARPALQRALADVPENPFGMLTESAA